MNYKEESIQLIANDSNNKFYLTPQGKQFLFSITKPIAIVSIAGMYRTGKSYLVNRLLKTKQVGFRTGSTTQSVTKGLNVWGRPIAATDERGNELYYIVIDSEGIGSCEQQVKYDLKLMMLVFLISSTVVYNSMGAIDEQALDQLRVIVNLKNSLAQQAPEEKTKLVWVLRDFALQLVDKNGYQISSNEYLQQCLEDAGGNSMDVRKKNQIRRAIRDGLGKKSCFTLVRPTISEEQLADLTKCKLRTEFINQIQALREEVFSGSSADLKRISGHPLNGKLLIPLLQQCISILNGNGMPELSTIWQSVKTIAYEQDFEELCRQLKVQVERVALPVSRNQLKIKLNQIQNKYYSKLQKRFVQIDGFKHYSKQFLKLLQKINREVKSNNQKLSKDKTMKQLKEFVKENISLSTIEPTNLSLVRTVVDRMQLKVRGEPQGYEYVLSVLFDLMHVSEQKSLCFQSQLNEYKRMVELNSLQQRNCTLSSLALKKDYHEALKTINNLKMTQQEHQKQINLSKHQLDVQQLHFQTLQQQWEIRENGLLRQIQQGSFKSRQKNQESSSILKKLRDQNTALMCQLSQIKEQKLREGMNQRKQVIFQQKMKQTFDRFDDERKTMRSQVQKIRKSMENWREKYEQEREYRQKESLQFAKQKQLFSGKQREFVEQIKQLKSMHAQAKKTYCATFDTIKDNDRILRSVENVAMSNSKFTTGKKGQNEDRQTGLIKQFYEGQLQKLRLDHEEEIRYVSTEIDRYKKLYEQQKSRCNEEQLKFRVFRQEKDILQKELATARERFADTVSEIQNAKERQRSLYEESIVRLLTTLDKKEGFNQYSSYRR